MSRHWAGVIALVAASGCGPSRTDSGGQTLVIAATGEPTTLIPPLVTDAVGRDVTDLIFERLATVPAGGSPNDPSGFRPGLAVRWTAVDSVTWRLVLRPGARWHDGQPVTPADVVFSFEAFVDSALGRPAPILVDRVTAVADGDSAVLVRFREPGTELLFDATWHVRVLPRHLWDSIPRSAWAADTAIARLVGSGSFRLTGWNRGQSLSLERAPGGTGQGDIDRIIWRFAGDQDAAINLLLSGESHLMETVTPPALPRVRQDTALRELPYPAAVYGFVGFLHRTARGVPHPLLANRSIRRALTLALDRPSLITASIGPGAVVPPGPMSRALWIWDDAIQTIGYDTAAAGRLLDSIGARRAADGIRWYRGRRMALDILVPATSTARRNLAQGIQEMWRRIGVPATVTTADFPIFQERLAAGRFETMIGAWLDEPTPRSLAEQWTRAGWGALNYGRYWNPGFDSVFAIASRTVDPESARRVWREAMDTLNADAAGIFLYTPTNVAVLPRWLEVAAIDPFSWLSGVAGWRTVTPP